VHDAHIGRVVVAVFVTVYRCLSDLNRKQNRGGTCGSPSDWDTSLLTKSQGFALGYDIFGALRAVQKASGLLIKRGKYRSGSSQI
jgi:hypothetical protein